MRYRNLITPVMLGLCAMTATHSDVWADIGGIGSPVVPSNPLPPEPATDTAVKPDEKMPDDQDAKEERKPVLVIRFNQHHVYFDRALKQAVGATENVRPGAAYDVISYTPPLGPQSQPGEKERDSESAMGNVNAVVQGLVGLGVQTSRIHTGAQSSDSITSQEIRIFVE